MAGGISSAEYQRSWKRTRRILAKRFFKPLRPSSWRVRKMPMKLGPRSMAGNIRMPVNFGSGALCRSFGAATSRAAVQEIAKVSRKQVSAGCFLTNEESWCDDMSAAMGCAMLCEDAFVAQGYSLHGSTARWEPG